MIYKFKSPASGDVIMLQPQGDQMLRLLGREPASQGIIESAAMPAAIEALQAAIGAAERAGAAQGGSKTSGDAPTDRDDGDRGAGVALRARLWPMVELMRRSHEADAPVVWGV